MSAYFDSFLGNGELKEELSSMLCTGRMPQALLIAGDDGCGRSLFGRMIAAAYLGESLDKIERKASPDYIEIEGQGASGMISVDSVRKAVFESHNSAVGPSGRRVFFIRDAHNLNGASAAALLKSLEEPLPGILYILTARSENDLLDTIRSRCMIFRVLPLSSEECSEEAVKRTGKPADLCSELSSFFGGRLGLVLDCLGNVRTAELYSAAKRFFASYSARDAYGMVLEATAFTERAPAVSFWEFVSVFFARNGLVQEHLFMESRRRDLRNNVNIRLFISDTISKLTKKWS